MKNKIIFPSLLLLIILIGTQLSSCKKKDSSPKETTFSDDEVSKAINVKSEEPPRSQKKFGEFESNGNVVSTPNTFNNDQNPEAKAKLEILTGNNAAAKILVNGIGGWNNNDEAVFFDIDGTYINFNYNNNSWDWGYYYINKELTVIVFDPVSQYENLWTIMSLTKDACTFKNKSNVTKTMDNIFMEGYEESSTSTTDTTSSPNPETYLKGVEWLSFEYGTTNIYCVTLTSQNRTFLDGGKGTTTGGSNTSSWTWVVTKANANIFQQEWLLTITEGSLVNNYYIIGSAENGSGIFTLYNTETFAKNEDYLTQSTYDSYLLLCQSTSTTTVRVKK